MSEMAQRVVRRYTEKFAADKIELKVKHPDVRSIWIEKGPRGWTYAYVAANGGTNTWVNKDRGQAKAKLIYALKSVIDPRNVEKTVRELDEKYDSGHRPPSKKEQIKKLYEEAKAAMRGLDVELPPGWQFRPVVSLNTTEEDAPKVKAKLRQLGYEKIRVLDNEDDDKYPKEVQGDPEPLIEV
jgi:hypothetical protein